MILSPPVSRFTVPSASRRPSSVSWVTASRKPRRGECLGLRWSDVDLDAGRASIVQTVIAVNHEGRFGSPKTARGRRTVVLDQGTVAALREHRQ